jgi:hypothetical protein
MGMGGRDAELDASQGVEPSEPRVRSKSRNTPHDAHFWQKGGGYDRNIFKIKTI